MVEYLGYFNAPKCPSVLKFGGWWRAAKVLAGQFSQKFLLVKPVFECLAPIDKNDRNFVCEPAAEAVIGFNIHFAPAKASSALKLAQLLLYDLAKVATFPGVNDHFAQKGHRRECSKFSIYFP